MPDLDPGDVVDPSQIPGVQDAPGRAEVAAYVAEMESYIPDLPIDWNDLSPAAAQEFAEQSVRNWAAANDVPLTESEVQQAALGWAEEELGVDLPANVREARDVAVEVAVTAACNAAGVDPRIGFVTYEALSDGELSEDDCEAIGQTAGAVAGAAIGQSFGIPAPIGAWVGGLIGGTVGKWFSDSFGIGEDPRIELWAAREEAMREWFAQADATCLGIRATHRFNRQLYLNTLIETWLRAELAIGVRFDLRWFGVRPYFSGWAFTHWTNPSTCWSTPRSIPPYEAFDDQKECLTLLVRTGRSGQSCHLAPTRCTKHGVVCTQRSHPSNVSGSVSNVYYTTTCRCEAEYGCAYPPWTRLYAGQDEVVRQVYAAMGPPINETRCALEEPTEGDYAWYARSGNLHLRLAWQDRVEAAIRREWQAIAEDRTKYTQVASDLMRTACVVAAEKQVAEQKLELAFNGTNTLESARLRGRVKRAVVNGGAMVLGLGFLGWVLWKGKR